jgi:hypothetical protein
MEISQRLPNELSNLIYSYMGTSPSAKLIADFHQHGVNTISFCEGCHEYDDSKYFIREVGRCEDCCKKDPTFHTGLGRLCDMCNEELHICKWTRLYGSDAGTYCIDCSLNVGEHWVYRSYRF